MCIYSSATHLVKELFSYGIRLDGKLQLCIHRGNTDIDLQKKVEMWVLNSDNRTFQRSLGYFLCTSFYSDK